MKYNLNQPPWGGERIARKFAIFPKRVFDYSAGSFVTIWLEHYQSRRFLSYMYQSWVDYDDEYDTFINK